MDLTRLIFSDAVWGDDGSPDGFLFSACNFSAPFSPLFKFQKHALLFQQIFQSFSHFFKAEAFQVLFCGSGAFMTQDRLNHGNLISQMK
jgi:hypothetical protein